MAEKKIRVLIAKPGWTGTIAAPKSLRARFAMPAWR
jgi:hypothetical protein